jgi:hypothetical protein
MAGEPNPWAGADWNASWQRTTVTQEEWESLCQSLREAAHQWQESVVKHQEWNDLTASGALASVAHTAYHLGAIRQILAATGE